LRFLLLDDIFVFVCSVAARRAGPSRFFPAWRSSQATLCAAVDELCGNEAPGRAF